jgi:uncharacterized protein
MTTSAPDPAPLSAEEIDQLDELLGTGARTSSAMPLDMLQGFLCAVVSGPVTIRPSAWIPVATGEDFEWSSGAEAQRGVELLIGFYNEIARGLSTREGFAPILYPREEGSDVAEYRRWATGYLVGVDLSEPGWVESAGDEAAMLLWPFIMLVGETGREEFLREHGASPADAARIIRDCEANLLVHVQAAYDFWLERRRAPSIQHKAPRVGRNDLCPCGSGKKYKRCGGAA